MKQQNRIKSLIGGELNQTKDDMISTKLFNMKSLRRRQRRSDSSELQL